MSYSLQGKPELQHLLAHRPQTLHMPGDTLSNIVLFTLSIYYETLFCCTECLYFQIKYQYSDHLKNIERLL